jgi:aminoglycoside phosphotransferase family enzyme/predicted kinase
MGSLVDDLASGERKLIETHISWVLLDRHDVYKLKKPVDLGFLDFRTLEQRREACEAEVRLNRRLAPDVYLGVVPVVRDEGGTHRLGGEGEPVDYAVHMKRLGDAGRADIRLAEDRFGRDEVDAIAERIARFHEAAARGPAIDRFGAPAAIAQNVAENFDQTRDVIDHYLSADEAAEVERFQREFVGRRAPFLERIDRRRICDGHGDLRLEHIYLGEDGAIRIIDCIEFNDRFRYQDTCADVAFLAMDLALSGSVALAERFLGRYAKDAQDYELYPLVDFYQSYRAYVRAKVMTFVAEDPGASAAARKRAEHEARRAFLLAVAYERAPLAPPSVVVVGGLIGSGKTTVADEVAFRLGGPSIDSDRTRKHLAGVASTAPLGVASFVGAYAEQVTEGVYTELMRRAALVLRSGRPVVLDASFRTRAYRARALELAEAEGVPFYFIECRTDRVVLEARLRGREGRSGVVSDGRAHHLEDFEARFEPIDELEAEHHLIADTSLSLDETLGGLEERLPFWSHVDD